MASNVARNRRWIAQTYLDSALCSRCQDWVDAHPERTTWQETAEIRERMLAAGLPI